MGVACKFGDLLTGLEEDRRTRVLALLDQRANPAEIMAESGYTGDRAVVRKHREKLCRCFSLEEAAAPGPVETVEKKPRVPIPRDWHPRAEYSESDGGYVVTSPRPDGEDPEPESLFSEFPDIDPARWDIKDVRQSRWQNAQGEWLKSFRAAFVPKQRTGSVDVADLLAVIDGYRDKTADERPTGAAAYVVPAGDLQLGKPDGDGTAGTIARFCEKTLAAAERLTALRARGEDIGTVVLPWLGDCIEGSVSQNGRNTATLDLWPSAQLRLYRRLMLFQVETFAPLAERVVVPVVPGNHDEVTRDQNLGGTESWAIEGAAAVADAIRLAPATFGHVEFVFPQPGELTATIDVTGTRIGCLHGHQMNGRDGAEKWLSGQALGRQPIGDADLLLTAHLHHFRCQEVGAGQTIIQTPALDGGSDWFRHRTGGSAPAGMLSFVVRDGAWTELSRH